MAYEHAMGFQAMKFELAACADIKADNAGAFAAYFKTPGIYQDYRRMLRQEKLDVLSICTWPGLHFPMVAAAIRAGVKAIHCEKPMAVTWGDSLRMAALAEKSGVQLTFNHQRRFGAPVQKALQLLRQGKLGELQRMESFVWNLYDSGTHQVDSMQMFNGEVPAKWVIGQVDARYGSKAFGAPVDNHCLLHVAYQNGVHGLVASARSGLGRNILMRLIGSEGEIEISQRAPFLRARLKGQGVLKVLPEAWDYFDPQMTALAVVDSMRAWQQKKVPQLAAVNALRAAEIVFACYESSRVHGRVDLPLKQKGNGLDLLMKSGAVKVVPRPPMKDWKTF
jgi:predicted dehydrogenase